MRSPALREPSLASGDGAPLLSAFIFQIDADQCPSLLCKVAGQVAQRGITASELRMISSQRECHVCLVIDEIEPHAASVLAEKFRAFIQVRSVKLEPVAIT